MTAVRSTQRARHRLAATAFIGGIALAGTLLHPMTASAASTCLSACLSSVDIAATPEGAILTFSTTGLTRARVLVSDYQGGHTRTVSDTWGTSFTVDAEDSSYFKQGNVYDVTIYATDTGGHTWEYDAQFATHVRQASVHFDDVGVIKDGDQLSAGDFAGDGRCGATSDWLALNPFPAFNQESGNIGLSDGQHQAVSLDYDCPGPVPSAVDVESALADDDRADHIWINPWQPQSPDYVDWNNSWWDQAYTRQSVADPMPATDTGTATVPFTTRSPERDPFGDVAAVRYDVSGTVTFVDSAPRVTLAAPVSQAATLSPTLHFDGDPSHATVSWYATAHNDYGPATADRVRWKKRADTVWQNEDVLSGSDLTITGLRPGTTYDIEVMKVFPGGLTAFDSPLTLVTAGSPPSPSTVAWTSTASVTAPVGTLVPMSAHVTPAGSSRTVQLQRKAAGGSWTTVQQYTTSAKGDVTVKAPVGVGYQSWRLAVLETPTLDGATTTPRLTIAKTAITGFDASPATAASGGEVKDGVVVAPGATRVVTLWYRRSGTTTWVLQSQLTTTSLGSVVLHEPVRKGSYQWQLVVPASPKHGSAASSVVRTITGT